MDIYERALEVANNIEYKQYWRVRVVRENTRTFIQIENLRAIDADSKAPTTWKSGKRYLSTWMCQQEIVGLIFDLIRAAEEHELREFFRYKGVAIYGPHLDPDKLVEFAGNPANLNCRENAMTMDETP